MKNKDKNYFFLILIHVVIGLVIFWKPFLSKYYGILILLIGFFFVFKTKNRNNEVLYASAYIVGAEVFLRMTFGNILYEFGKYGVIIFVILGMLYSGFSKRAMPYWIFLLLLIPGIIIATATLDLGTDIRKTIIFNISGPICLGIASLYTFGRKVTVEELNNILLLLGLPIISCVIYVSLYTPELKTILLGNNSSNPETSGGFGPNQVSTVLGLGMFIFFSRLLFNSQTKILFAINLVIGLVMSYRGLLTFSRGGMITGFLMFIILFLFVYMNSLNKQKLKLNYMIAFFVVILFSIFIFSENMTGGLISKRYSNQDAMGRTKVSKFSGREEIAQNEINAFLDHPFFGIGVAKGLELRLAQTGSTVASHDEITRMLAEHGSLGILGLLILFFTPIILYLDNRQHIFMFCFLTFWLLTINHAAMRTSMPAFVYSLSILKITFNEKEDIIYREQII